MHWLTFVQAEPCEQSGWRHQGREEVKDVTSEVKPAVPIEVQLAWQARREAGLRHQRLKPGAQQRHATKLSTVTMSPNYADQLQLIYLRKTMAYYQTKVPVMYNKSISNQTVV